MALSSGFREHFPSCFPITNMMIVLRRSLYGVVSDRNVLGIVVPLPPAVLIGFTHEANIALEAGLGKFVSQCCVHRVSLTVTKQPDFDPRSIRAM